MRPRWPERGRPHFSWIESFHTKLSPRTKRGIAIARGVSSVVADTRLWSEQPIYVGHHCQNTGAGYFGS